MSVADFLHKDAETPLSEMYTATGALCKLSTNCEQLLEAARDSFLPANGSTLAADFSLRFWVDKGKTATPPWPKPYVRGLDHLVFAAFDCGSCLLADLRRRHVAGRFSSAMACDVGYWKTVIFPILLTIVGAALGIAELHCACVAKNDDGLLLAGPSGSGKSTLAFALSQMGYGFLSDDQTFCSLANGEVLAWGLATRLKLRFEAMRWFEELRHVRVWNGGEAKDVWIEPESIGLSRLRFCRPRCLIFLERRQTPCFRLRRLSATESAERLEMDLMAEAPEGEIKRAAAIRRLVQVQCRLLEYGGDPRGVASRIGSEVARF